MWQVGNLRTDCESVPASRARLMIFKRSAGNSLEVSTAVKLE